MRGEEQNLRGPGTVSVHGGDNREKAEKSLTHPIFQTSTFTFDSVDEFVSYKAGKLPNYEYGRYGNPTVRAAECKLAVLDDAEDALLFPSGMSAITSVLLAMLRHDQHFVIMEDCYRMTIKFGQMMARYGISCTAVKSGDWVGLENAVCEQTRLVLAESPTNPHLNVIDLVKLVSFCRKRSLRTLVDSTFATPVNQRPLAFGVDLVLHSCTKYLGGHNDLLAGSVCGSQSMVDAIKEFRDVIGSNLDPHSAYLLIRGLKTLSLRVERQNETALELARFLEDHRRVRRVFYPGLPSHPDHSIASQQLRAGGGVVSFEIEGNLDDTKAFISALKLPQNAPSLGGVESLVQHPASVSYYDMSHSERMALGITDELVRYAVGIEDVAELRDDLASALDVL